MSRLQYWEVTAVFSDAGRLHFDPTSEKVHLKLSSECYNL